MLDRRLKFIPAVFALLIALICLFGASVLSADNNSQANASPADAIYKEDINEDGAINIMDVIALLILIRDDPENPVIDYNSDGNSNIMDVISLLVSIRDGNMTPELEDVFLLGRVILDGQGMEGIEVKVKGPGFELTVPTDSNGFYSILGKFQNETYTVGPKENFYYTFIPASLDVLIDGDTVTVPDIEAIPASNSLSGRVLEDSVGLPGVTVSIKGPDMDTTLTTDSLGAYHLEDLLNASYLVVPQMENYTFTPFNLAVNVKEDTVATPDIIATPAGLSPAIFYTIRGMIYCTVAPVANIQVFLAGDLEASTITDANGFFTFMVPNGNYTIVPLAFWEDQGFNPPTYKVTVNGNDILDLHFLAWGAPELE